MYQLSSPCLAHLSHSISDQISMYLHHHHRHCYHYHYHGYKYQIQRAIQDEGLGNFSPRSTFELTFVFFAMFVFRYIIMFYANRLISAWNDHHSHRDHTHQLWKTTGLNSSAIASLPVFMHGVIGERDLGVTIDCVVCFSTVEEGERVRVLPNCRHSFHVACIDIWLRLHSTCPLCRGSV